MDDQKPTRAERISRGEAGGEGEGSPPPRLEEPWGRPESDRREYFDALYRSQPEPWLYSDRAAEVMRHDAVVELARSLGSLPRGILDIGCSLGQLTARLSGVAPEVYGVDLSPTAVQRARARCAALEAEGLPASRFRFAVAGCTRLPFADGAMSLALLCDGLHSWRLSGDDQDRTLAEIHRVLEPGGRVILTEHLRPGAFDAFIARVSRGPLEVVAVRYLHNRLWFSMARALRGMEDRRVVRAILGSRALGRVLEALSRLAGSRGAKHIVILARRTAE